MGNGARDLDYWKRMVRGCVAGGTDADVEAVAQLCVVNPGWGVLHAVAQHTGKPCWCATCRPNVRRPA